jgi:hypothetical protein
MAETKPAVDGTVYEAVTVEPFSPKEIPFELLNVSADKLLEVVPAEKLMLEIKPAVDGTVYEAVICDEPDMPKVIPLEFANATLPEVAV